VQEYFSALANKEPYYSILGLICNHPENVKIHKKKRQPIDYKALPYPDFKDFPLDKYIFRQLPVMMSRGCIATCSFCTEFLTWKSYRVRTALDVVEEIKNNIVKYNINNFFFCDSLINGNYEQLMELTNGLQELDCTWTAFCRVDKRLTKNLLENMFKSGCQELLIGFESNSQKVLDSMNKGTTIQENQRVLDDAFDVGIKVHGLFLVGFPGESNYDFYKTLTFIHMNKNKFYVFSIGKSLTIHPLSIIGKLPRKFNLLTSESGNLILDSEGDWTSSDKKLTPITREKRLDILRNYLNSMNLKWVPQLNKEKTRFEKIKQAIFYKYLKLYYQAYFKFRKDKELN
jgi:radical SAM superfamily enzyme YgiQ (UPF0313 family)